MSPTSQGTRTQRQRAPDATRASLLLSAYQEIHRQGFQAASLNEILKLAGVTKGALYHHFQDKRALGLAVLDEVIAPELRRVWIEPLSLPDSHPIDALIGVIERSGHEMTLEDILLGCPLNNLAQEMSALDEAFRLRIETLYSEWRDGIVTALERGQREGQVNSGLDTRAAATFIVATLEGCIGSAKNAQSKQLLMHCGKGLIDYLTTLRTPSELG